MPAIFPTGSPSDRTRATPADPTWGDMARSGTWRLGVSSGIEMVDESTNMGILYIYMAVCQNLVPLVNIKIAGKWMFIPLKMVLIGIDPYPYYIILYICMYVYVYVCVCMCIYIHIITYLCIQYMIWERSWMKHD